MMLTDVNRKLAHSSACQAQWFRATSVLGNTKATSGRSIRLLLTRRSFLVGRNYGFETLIRPLFGMGRLAAGAGERDAQTYAIIGAAMDVHRELGPGFLESVYGDALEMELKARHIAFAREVPCPVHYKKQRLSCRFTADFVCHGCIVLELKAARGLTETDFAQTLNYLKATGLRRAATSATSALPPSNTAASFLASRRPRPSPNALH